MKRSAVRPRGDRALGLQLELRDSLDFVVLVGLTLVLPVFILVTPHALPPLRIGLSLVFLLLAPGYALSALLFPERDAIDPSERLALSFGLSMVSVPLVGLMLNYTPWGIRLLPMTFGLAAFTLILLLGAYYQRQRLAPRSRFFSRYDVAILRQGSLVLATAMLIGTLVIVSAQALRPPQSATEFYLLGSGGRLENFPDVLRPGQPFSVTLAVRHAEKDSEAYRVRLPSIKGGSEISTPEIARTEVWQHQVTLEAPTGSGRQQLSFELYRRGETEPYRVLHLYVTLAPTPQENIVMCPGGQPC